MLTSLVPYIFGISRQVSSFITCSQSLTKHTVCTSFSSDQRQPFIRYLMYISLLLLLTTFVSCPQVSDEALSRVRDDRVEERDSGARHDRRRRRGHEHAPQGGQDDSQEQGPSQPRPGKNGS